MNLSGGCLVDLIWKDESEEICRIWSLFIWRDL